MTTGKLLSRVYKRFIWATYENIGRLILINLFWFLLLPLPSYLIFKFMPVKDLNLRLLLTSAYLLFMNSYATGGVFVFTAKTVRRLHANIKDFFRFSKSIYFLILAVSLIYALVIALLLYGIRFYASSTRLGIVGKGLAIWQITMLLLVLFAGQYSLPLVVLREMGIKKCLKFSGLLMVLRPAYSVLIFVQAIGLAFILAVTGIGIVVLATVAVSTFLNSATEISIREIEKSAQTPTKPTSWKEIFAEETEEDRPLRDLFRPWKTE